MRKISHEFRDPIHTFIHAYDEERAVIDSVPVQRLRHIHQLAMTFLVYPGATHRRFEHSLGVMDLAGRVYDIVTHPDNLHPGVRDLFPELRDDSVRLYWRRVVRMAALCHDIGHLPFSHAAERELLPEGWSHERMTVELILSPQMKGLFENMTPPLKAVDVAKIAVGKECMPDESFSDLEAVLSEIIVGEAFGVDRMDYLLRDSLHTGVAYGRFDHSRLIDTLRVLPPPASATGQGSTEPHLGVEEGGLRSAEALLLARYFMYSQVYFHPVRRAYDIHLKDFILDWLSERKFPTAVDEFLKTTDSQIIAALWEAANDRHANGYDSARRIAKRDHFKVLWERNPEDLKVNPEAGELILRAAQDKFGYDAVRRDAYAPKTPLIDFPVLQRDGRIASAQELSEVVAKVPTAAFDYVFIDGRLLTAAKDWLEKNRSDILGKTGQGDDDEERRTTGRTTNAAPSDEE